MNINLWLPKAFWVLAGIFIALHAYQLGVGRFSSPGPGFIFFCAALFLLILGIIDFGQVLFRRAKEGIEESVWKGVRLPKILSVLGVLFTYIILLGYLGFSLATFLLMVALLKIGEPTKWWVAVLGSTIATIVSYSLFKIWLEVPFPRGFIGF